MRSKTPQAVTAGAEAIRMPATRQLGRANVELADSGVYQDQKWLVV